MAVEQNIRGHALSSLMRTVNLGVCSTGSTMIPPSWNGVECGIELNDSPVD